MLPDHPLLRRAPLRSFRSGTTFDPELMVLRFGDHALELERPITQALPETARGHGLRGWLSSAYTRAARYRWARRSPPDMAQATIPASEPRDPMLEGPQVPWPPLVSDDSTYTMLHEGLHWRQLAGTTLGAFLSWLKHARELDALSKLHNLPPPRLSALLRARMAGRPLLAIDDQGLPDPPIIVKQPCDPVKLLRCVFFDSFLLSRLFTDPIPIVCPHAKFQDIFASVIADAAEALKSYHPMWRDRTYESI
jgi:hypothetical protein